MPFSVPRRAEGEGWLLVIRNVDTLFDFGDGVTLVFFLEVPPSSVLSGGVRAMRRREGVIG